MFAIIWLCILNLFLFTNANFNCSNSLKIIAKDGGANDYFGQSVAVSSKFVFVGAYSHSHNNLVQSGYVFIFERQNGWKEKLSILSPNASSNGHFGWSLSANEDILVVGAEGENSNSGLIHIFSQTDFSQTQVLYSNTGFSSRFGYCSALFGNHLAVGSPGDKFVYIYLLENTSWNLKQTISLQSNLSNSNFGISISLSSNWILVGDSLNNKAHLFQFTSNRWNLFQTLTPTHQDTTDDKNFGSKVLINNEENILIIAGYLEASTGIDSGAIYIFALSSTTYYNQSQRIVPLGLQQFGHFGEDMVMVDDLLLVGAHRQSTSIPEGGIVFVFSKNESHFEQNGNISSSNVSPYGWFGRSLAIHKDSSTLVIGANQENTVAVKAGAAYIYSCSNSEMQSSSSENKSSPIKLIVGLCVAFGIIIIIAVVALVAVRYRMILRKHKQLVEE